MKKTRIAVALFAALFFIASTAFGSNEKKIDSKKLKAENIQIHKKKYLPAEEKGKPTGKPGQVSTFNATGVLGEPTSGQKYAVVIGICDYPGSANDICKSDGDAYNMNEALTLKYGFDSANIHLLRDGNATYDNIVLALNDILNKATANDEIVFFFSGHGTTANVADGDKERIDEGIVVHDGTNPDFIWDGQLKNWFESFPTSRIVFVFDSCKAGGMNDVAKEGRLVVMSSAEKENSFVYTNGYLGEGLFSHFFVNEGMLQNKADGYNLPKTTDGNVATEEAAVYAKEKVSSYADTYLWHSQTVTVSDNFGDDLLL